MTERKRSRRKPKDTLSWVGGYRTSYVTANRARDTYGHGGPVWVRSYTFDQIHDLFDEEINPFNHDENKALIRRIHGSLDTGDDREFYVGRFGTLAGVRRLLTAGWPEGAERIEKMAEQVEVNLPTPRGIRRRLRWADDGDEYDKDRLFDGHWDTPWRSTHRAVQVATPVIDILTSMDGNCDRNHDQLFWSGAAALSLMHKLEGAGYQTSLTAAITNEARYSLASGHSASYFMLKQAGDPLQPDALAAVVCSGAVFRTFGFQAIARAPFELSYGLGRSIPSHELVKIAVGEGVIDRPQVVLPQVYYEDDARQAVLKALNDLQEANLAALPNDVEVIL